MNLLLIICAAFGVVLAEKSLVKLSSDVIAKVQPYIDKCEAEVKPPSNAFRNLANATIDDEESLKFVYCYLTAIGHVDTDGRLIADTFEQYFVDDKVKKDVIDTLEECEKVNGEDPQEVLRKEIACFKEKSPIYVIFEN